jgi:hypothetical protein
MKSAGSRAPALRACWSSLEPALATTSRTGRSSKRSAVRFEERRSSAGLTKPLRRISSPHGERRRPRCPYQLRPQRRRRRGRAERLALRARLEHLLRPQRASPGVKLGSGARRRDRPFQRLCDTRRQAWDQQYSANGKRENQRARNAPLDRDCTTITNRRCRFCL